MPMVSMRCGPYELKEKDSAYTTVGELFTDPDTAVALFEYGRQADSDIGVGMRTGGRGPFSVSGDHHVSNGFKNSVVHHAKAFTGQDRAVRTKFNYGRFEQDCYDLHNEQLRSLGWDGGGMLPEPIEERGCTGVPEDNVHRYGPGEEFNREDERAATYGGAAEAFGFEFRARSGHSKWVKMHWQFGDEPMHRICGDDGPPSTSKRIFLGETVRQPECRPGRPC